jgi:photosystem II stability/assembly factor-like uncharacterized protein
MNRTDDLLDLLNGLRPVMLDRLADDGYARHRSGDLARAAAEGDRQPPGVRRRRLATGLGRPRWSGQARGLPVVAAVAAAAVALAVVAAQFGPWHLGASARGSRPAARPSSAGSPGGRAEPPAASSPMRLVASTSWPFRSSGSGLQAASLECVTASVCYVWDAGSEGQTAYRTSDGGATWRRLAALPGGRSLAGQNAGPPSCPTAEMCAGAAGGMTLAVTTDGGARWRAESLPAPAGMPGAAIGQVACATALRCVVQAGGTFLTTANGGRTWTQAAGVRKAADLWYLRCDRDGACIGLAPAGTNTNGGIVSMRSTDGGRTWAVSGPHHAPASDLFMVSCGDALHCMDVSDGGATMTTSDGGLTWQDTAPVSTSPGSVIPLSVSCATALDCFVAVSGYSQNAPDITMGPGGYQDARIEATHDGGAAWTTIELPTVAGAPLAAVFPLSCPSQAGCIGLAATARQANGVDSRREIISSFPDAGSPATGG